VGLGIPPKSYTQEQIFEAMGHRRLYWDIFRSAGIEQRHLCLEPTAVVQTSPQDQHDNYGRFALELSKQSVADCLQKAGMAPEQVDMVVYVSCTGAFTSPPMSSEIAFEMGMRDDVIHVPIAGAGCAGAGPGLRRAWEHSRLYPQHKILCVCTEISNSAWHPDVDLGLVVGNSIFADGSSCYLVEGPDEIEVVRNRRGVIVQVVPAQMGGLNMLDMVEFHDYAERHTVAMVLQNARYKLVLPERTSEISTPMAVKAVTALLKRNGLVPGDISHWVIHSGGKSILHQFCAATNLPQRQLRHSFEVWRNFGNMSSSTIGFALSSLMQSGDLARGDRVMMVMLGAGFTAQALLLQAG